MNDYRDELDKRLKEKIQKHECISEPELLERISEIYDELKLTIDDLNDKTKEIESINLNSVVKNCCKHYKGQHSNDYHDCTVVCDLHDDDHVSRDSCANCEDFVLKEESNDNCFDGPDLYDSDAKDLES